MYICALCTINNITLIVTKLNTPIYFYIVKTIFSPSPLHVKGTPFRVVISLQPYGHKVLVVEPFSIINNVLSIETWLLIVQSIHFLNWHTRFYNPCCSGIALRSSQQLDVF